MLVRGQESRACVWMQIATFASCGRQLYWRTPSLRYQAAGRLLKFNTRAARERATASAASGARAARPLRIVRVSPKALSMCMSRRPLMCHELMLPNY